MGKVRGKILKIILVIVVIAVLAALIYWLVSEKGWPWWVGLIIFIGVLGLWVGFLYLKKYLLRRREREFVRRVVAQDEEAIKSAPEHERLQLKELQEHWAESIELLRHSYLRKKGNPLYVLPWYMILGEAGSGKTSAIKNARLSSPLTDVSRTAGISGTRNCDWWFFEEAVLLDTAGRYTIPVDEGRDKEEWEKFLTLLSKYRRREPINGVILAIPAERLLGADEVQLREEGQSIRKRIDQLMHVLGAKFPVYIMVTKMDMVHGMTDFCRHLPQETLVQAMGSLNIRLNPYWQEMLEKAMSDIGNRLRALRFVLIHQTTNLEPGAFLFPSEFQQLRPGLTTFVKAVFEENPYQETPLFRGLYFSCARQNGQIQSEFLQLLSIEPKVTPVKPVDQGLFLKDFFKRIIPKDRNLFSPILAYLRWRRMTISLGMLSWMLIWLCVCGLLGFSFLKNKSSLEEFVEQFTVEEYRPPALTHDTATDLLMLDRLRLEILKMDQVNEYWLMPRFGLRQSLDVENRLKRRYLDFFRTGLLNPLDRSMIHRIQNVNNYTPEEEILDYVGFVVARITLLQEYLKQEKPAVLDKFRTISVDILSLEHKDIPPEISARFGDLYYTYLLWNKDNVELQQKLDGYQVALVVLLNNKGANLEWLVRTWIYESPDIHLDDFWGEPERESFKEKAFIHGAYTEKGRQHIQEFEKLLVDALAGDVDISDKRARFWRWYHRQFFAEWQSFSAHMHDGINGLESSIGWQNMATQMTTGHNPYFRFLERLSEEIEKLGDVKDAPSWAALALELNEVRKTAMVELKQAKTKESLAAKVEKSAQKLKGSLEKMTSQKTKELELRYKTAKVWENYLQELEKIAPAATSSEISFHMVSNYFSFQSDPPKDGSPFQLAYTDYTKIKNLMQKKGRAQFIWDIVIGPLRFLEDFCVMEAACVLHAQWEDQVLGGIKGVKDEKLPLTLFDAKDGLVWKFVSGIAKPFISRNRHGYFAHKALDRTIPFKETFFEFLNNGIDEAVDPQSQFNVEMETLPLEVNEDVSEEPYACIVCLQCADKRTCLENYNYPQNQTFKWDPTKCGDITIKILLPGLTLMKKYTGSLGFAHFLSEFRDGSRTFLAEEFPESEELLKEKGISWIKLSYKISGSDAVIALLHKVPPKVPDDIVFCWSK